ncbi:MAG: MFS transporter [Oscillospiraceae bacterium]|nr:MFS transporter [Oscillospiraceae bacterium]
MKDQKSNFGKFLLLWSGELISSIGGGLTSFGLGVYVFASTGSAASMSLITLFGFLPTLMLSVPAGVLADRYDRRLLMMAGDGFSALGVIFILICMMNGGASVSQICAGVFISAVFSSLLEPSFRATITDLLTGEEYSKASGLVSLAGSARYLISPVIAGFLLSVADIKLLLIIDIFTFIITVSAAAVVKKSISTRKTDTGESFLRSMKGGWKAITDRKGILMLVIVSSVISMFMGMFQILAEPMILSFSDAATLGTAETICACGMLVSGIVIGIKGIKKNYVTILSAALVLSGLFMTGFGLTEHITTICIFGFMFFAALPFANNCLDYLARTNIPDELQGRAWGMIGFISQLGYVIAYSVSGAAADTIGSITGTGVGRGAAIVICAAGLFLAAAALCLPASGSIRALEKTTAGGAVLKL